MSEKIYKSASELIGKTPLLELTNIEKNDNLEARLLAKLEYFNPAGSVKDRIAFEMIEDAEERSYNVCEICGKHIDKPIRENHWIYAECEECHQKWLDKRAKAFEAYEK